jgi:hypothetical protein
VFGTFPFFYFEKTMAESFSAPPIISGYCRYCEKEHQLSSELAIPHCLDLMDKLESEQRIDFSVGRQQAEGVYRTDYLFGNARGHMFGVMVYLDNDDRQGTARAFSGQYNGKWNAPGWVPPVLAEDDFFTLTSDVEKRIKSLGRQMEALSSDSEQYQSLMSERRDLSRSLMRKIHELYTLTNFRGESASMPSVATSSKGLPSGTGDCCAPKLLNYAARNGLRPLSIAEFYFGRENKSQTKRHKEFYSSCADKCGLILGFMLCGLQISN